MVGSSVLKTTPVAIIVPCYNYGRFIGATIERISDQSISPAEIIVVDDGSTDETGEVCRRYEQIKYIYQPNGGPSSARNSGLAASTSQYVMFLDADDILCVNGLEILWNASCKLNHQVPVIFGRSEVFGQSDVDAVRNPSMLPSPNDVFPYIDKEINDDLFVLSLRVLERMVRGSIVPQCSALIHRSVYEQVGAWNESLRCIEDREMWLRIANHFPLAYVNQTVAKVRRHSDNITHGKNWFRNHEAVLKVLNGVRDGDWADTYLRDLAVRQYGMSAYLLAQRYTENCDFLRASQLMWSSWKTDRRRWKSLAQAGRYYMKSLRNR
jgi:glycosyltransferase involved in cell wall biosynthesis